jgi:hypothetical protein
MSFVCDLHGGMGVEQLDVTTAAGVSAEVRAKAKSARLSPTVTTACARRMLIR